MTHETKKGKGKRLKANCNIVLPYEAKLNENFLAEDCINKLSVAFQSKKHENWNNEITMHCNPFQCCHMTHLISDEQFLEGLRDELVDQIFYEKNNDLYRFQQTDDLKQLTSPHVKMLRKFFNEDFRLWLSSVTGLTFSDRIDLTCSKYESGDILLCHDDELDSRRIAFAFYLVSSWSEEDGGRLDLFNMDEHGQPNEVITSILPSWNSLSWFEVTEASHHQVSEILSDGKSRLSVNGWYHTVPIPRNPRYVEPKRLLHEHIHVEEQMIYEWLNPIYLDAAVQTEIREKFSEESEIELQEFLKDEKYQELLTELSRSDIQWTSRGPPNKRCYHSLSEDNMPDIVQQCIKFLRSEAVFLVLSNLTGLRLHELAAIQPNSDDSAESDGSEDEIPTLVEGESFDRLAEANKRNTEARSSIEKVGGVEAHAIPIDEPLDEAPEPEMIKRQRMSTDSVATSRMSVDSVNTVQREDSHEEKKRKSKKEVPCDPKCRYEVRRWRHGCYTLVHDTDAESTEFALDASLYCLSRDWLQEYGGTTSYIAKGEDEELLTICPAANSLALVYRDKDTLKFVKHINHRSIEKHKDLQFYDLAFSYYEHS